jgi:hypothetical protein
VIPGGLDRLSRLLKAVASGDPAAFDTELLSLVEALTGGTVRGAWRVEGPNWKPQVGSESPDSDSMGAWSAAMFRRRSAFYQGPNNLELALWLADDEIHIIKLVGASFRQGLSQFLDTAVALRNGASSSSASAPWAAELLAECASSTLPPLRERLGQLAGRLGAHPGVKGTFLLAIDGDGRPLGVGEENLRLRRRRGVPADLPPHPVDLSNLYRSVARGALPDEGWTVQSTSFEEVPANTAIRAWPVLRNGLSAGLLVVAFDNGAVGRSITTQAALWASLCDAPVRDILRQTALQRSESICDLAVSLTPEVLDPVVVVARLQSIFHATSVSLFRESEEPGAGVVLEASTDPELLERAGASPAHYQPHEGLTGTVFARGVAVRLSDARDGNEIRARVGLEGRQGPLHSEVALEGEPWLPFLAVPVFEGRTPTGVIRLTRRACDEPFTEEDEAALQRFGHLLGRFVASREALLPDESASFDDEEPEAATLPANQGPLTIILPQAAKNPVDSFGAAMMEPEASLHPSSETDLSPHFAENLAFAARILGGGPLGWDADGLPLASISLEVAEELAPLAMERGLDLSVDSESIEELSRIRGNPAAMRRVIQNLLHAALLYAEEGARVEVAGTIHRWVPAFEVVIEGNWRLGEASLAVLQGAAHDPMPAGRDAIALGLWVARQIVLRHAHELQFERVIAMGSAAPGHSVLRILFLDVA